MVDKDIHAKTVEEAPFVSMVDKESQCKDCEGGLICKHGKQRSTYKDKEGGSICQHGRQRSRCIDCGGTEIYKHGRIRSTCKDCGGASICQHDNIGPKCKDCEGCLVCEHGRERSRCIDSDPLWRLAHVIRCRVSNVLKEKKKFSSQEYLGCNMETFKKHIKEQFTEQITWENYGKVWHIVHKILLKYKEDGIPPTLEEVCKRLHYTA